MIAVRESLHQVEEIQCACSLVNALVDNAVELMRMWLQGATLTNRASKESAGMLRSEEVTNTCALANKWANEELMVEHAIQEAMDNYQVLETNLESENY